jgi:hypothetical protein
MPMEKRMYKNVARLGAAGLVTMLLAPGAYAQTAATDQDQNKELATLKSELAAQRALVDKLMLELQAQRSKIERIEERRDKPAPALADTQAMPPRADDLLLSETRGTGGQNSGAPANVQANAPANVQANSQPNQRPPSTPGPIGGQAPAQPAARGPAQAQQTTATRNERDQRPPEVAPLFEAPGVLTPRGKYILEPSLQFGYSSSNRVALVGYTVIPALLIGLVDVREVKRNTFTGALTARTGLNNRMEVEVKLPYVYRSDATVSRELFTGTAVERVFETSGKAIGDVEVAGRYQLNNGGPDKPYYIGGLRYKSTTGRSPFEVVTDCQTRCIGDNVTGTGLPLSLPTWLFPSDPAVFFGNVSYLHNFKRSGVTRLVRGGIEEPLGDLAPGGIIGFNFGMGLALNEKASLSLGYDHSTVGRMKQNGNTVPGSVRTQLGTLLLGYSYRFNEKRSLSIAVGAGVTRDTPDVSLTIRVPFTF